MKANGKRPIDDDGLVVFAFLLSFYVAIMDTLFTNNVTKCTHDLNLSSLVISRTVHHRSTTDVQLLDHCKTCSRVLDSESDNIHINLYHFVIGTH